MLYCWEFFVRVQYKLKVDTVTKRIIEDSRDNKKTDEDKT